MAISLFGISARPAGFQNAASAVWASAMPAWPSAVVRAPTAISKNVAPPSVTSLGVWPARGRVRPRPATIRASLERLRLINEHDRDIVLDRVDEAAGVAGELFLGLGVVFEVALALGADEDFKQVGRQAHSSLRVGPTKYPMSDVQCPIARRR